ncbi:MAG: hypothetical protein KGD60_14735 [Candidatus Thorarchaeota archaeon]|nr:hypothetical protein [Candidatus Thorarchaeota archaeon]
MEVIEGYTPFDNPLRLALYEPADRVTGIVAGTMFLLVDCIADRLILVRIENEIAGNYFGGH